MEKGLSPEQTFNHYLKRFKAHKDSENLEIEATSNQKQRHLGPMANLEYNEILAQTTDVLLEARRTLKYTYIYAYHLDKDKRRVELDLFECHQQDLENHTERLSRLQSDACQRVIKDQLQLCNECGIVIPRDESMNSMIESTIATPSSSVKKPADTGGSSQEDGVSATSETSVETSTQEMLNSLRDQTLATSRFLNSILQLISEDDNSLVVAESSEAIVHTSWFCENCGVGKKDCKCAVGEILALEEFASLDRAIVEKAVKKAGGDGNIAKTELARAANSSPDELVYDSRHDWFVGVR